MYNTPDSTASGPYSLFYLCMLIGLQGDMFPTLSMLITNANGILEAKRKKNSFFPFYCFHFVIEITLTKCWSNCLN